MRHITLYFCDSVICVCVCRTACCLGVQVRHIALCFCESVICVCVCVCVYVVLRVAWECRCGT